MFIRAATAADAEAIAQLHAASWRTAYRGIYRDDYLDGPVDEDRRAVWIERFATPRAARHVIVAEGSDGLEGFICVEGDEDARWGSLIDNLHVTPDRKRSGTGKVLMRDGARWLEEHYPESPVYLWVLEHNTNARGFYERLGATNTETVMTDTTDGGRNSSCRYTWGSPADLSEACS